MKEDFGPSIGKEAAAAFDFVNRTNGRHSAVDGLGGAFKICIQQGFGISGEFAHGDAPPFKAIAALMLGVLAQLSSEARVDRIGPAAQC